MKYRSLQQKINESRYDDYRIYDPYPYNYWGSKKCTTVEDARHSAKTELSYKGHKIKFEAVSGNTNHNVGKCKHCGLSAGILFIPFAEEFVLVGKAFDTDCTNKKVDTVSNKKKSISYYNKTSYTPVKQPEVLSDGDMEYLAPPAVALPNQGFNVSIYDYPFGIASENGCEIWQKGQ